MDRRPRKKPKDGGPILKRDEHNTLDQDDAQKAADGLMRKLLSEQRAHEKDESMHMAKTGRRDIVVHMAVTVRGQVNGHPIIGETDKEYNQWCFEIPARALPINNAKAVKAFAELCHLGKQALMKLGMINI